MTLLIESDATYQASIRAAVRALWSGVFDATQFLNNMLLAFRKELPKAWAEGAAVCGITPADYSDAEKAALEQIIVDELGYAADFADYITEHSKRNGYKLTPLFVRVEMWVNRRAETRERAMNMACADQPLTWFLGSTKDHCADCAWYANKTYRASTWAKYGIYPKSRSLACGGYHCGCERRPTKNPITKGRPKKMTYG